jgi:hypothetical protein
MTYAPGGLAVRSLLRFALPGPAIGSLLRFASLAGMRTRTAQRLTRTAVVLVILSGCLWSLSFAWILLFKSEGLLPPRWRIPEVPHGVAVLEDDKNCASGGCWWSLTLRPPAGQSPEDLKRQLGLEAAEELLPTLTDPGYVTRSAEVSKGDVVVRVSYD